MLFKNEMLFVLLISVFISVHLSAQEITNLIIVQEETNLQSFKALFLADDIYVDGEKAYINLQGPGVRDLDLGLDFSSIPEGQVQISPTSGVDWPISYDFYMEYSENGFSDFTAIMNLSFQEPVGINGNHIAYAFAGARGWFDDLKLFGDSTTYFGDEDVRNDIAVYDKLNDTLLWHYEDHNDYSHKLLSQGIDIDGDYLYYAMTFNHPHLFMGDSLVRTNTTSLGNNYSSVLHKINWRTNEKLWSYNMASEIDPDEIWQVKVLDDGSVMLAIESYGPFTWDGVTLDPYHMTGSSDGGYHNVVLANISAEGEYLNHVHLWSPGNFSAYDVQIEPNGNVYAYGTIQHEENYPGFVEVHGDSIRFESGTYATGNLLAFDKELNLRWHKEYGGDRIVYVSSVNELQNNEVIVNVWIHENVVIEGTVYENEYFDNEYFGEPNPLKQNYIIHYNGEGDLLSSPFPFGDSFRTQEIIELEEDRYLFLLRNHHSEFSTPTFLDQEIGLYHEEYNTIMEVEGSFLESITAVNDFVKAEDIESYPNPVIESNQVSIALPEKCVGQEATFRVYDLQGKLYSTLNHINVQQVAQLSSDYLSEGLNTVLIYCNNRNYKTRILKIN